MQSSLSRMPLALRLGAFRALERTAAMRHRLRGTAAASASAAVHSAAPSLWVFVSTIGELNAIEPFLKRLLEALGQPPLTLISDRLNYHDAYRAKYPDANLVTLQVGTTAQAAALTQQYPPLMLLVAEIPCRLHDAPCRFSFATLAAARRAGAPTVLVNGWLYGYAPPSRMDRIENDLFASDYVRGFDLMMVQTGDIRQRLVAAGAAPEQVAVTGNIKFDSMQPGVTTASGSALLEPLMQRTAGPVIVAGSVTDSAEQLAVLGAFAQVRAAYPGALLILAPRHPENSAAMHGLLTLLQEHGLRYRLRSEHDASAAMAEAVTVLDTIGELRSCYAAATLAFVGRDHSVLEPLTFGKPVYVGPGWEPTYPSYPVYMQLMEAGALAAPTPLAAMGEAWLSQLQHTPKEPERDPLKLLNILEQARGAAARSMSVLQSSAVWQRLLRP